MVRIQASRDTWDVEVAEETYTGRNSNLSPIMHIKSCNLRIMFNITYLTKITVFTDHYRFMTIVEKVTEHADLKT